MAAKQFLTDADFEDAAPLKPVKTGVLGRAGDLGLSALKSAIAVPETAVGLANLVSGGKAGKAVEDAGVRFKDAKQILDDQKSVAGQLAQRRFDEAQGFTGKLGAAIENPSLIASTLVESAAPMLAGGVVGRGLSMAAPRLAGYTGAIGEGAIGAGSAAEQIRQESNDGELSGKQAALAGASGLATGLLGYGGSKLAGRLGVGDIDTALAGGARTAGVQAGKEAPGMLKRIGGGALSEGVFEELPQSVSEQVLQNVALDRDPMQGVDAAAAMGLLSGGVMGGGMGVVSGQPKQQATPAQPPVAPGTTPGAPTASTPPAGPTLGQSLTGTQMADLMGGGGLTGGANPLQAGLSTLTSNNQMYPGMNTEPTGYTVDPETGAIIPADPVGVRQMAEPAAQVEAPAPVAQAPVAPAQVAPTLGESLTGTPVADMLGSGGMSGPANPLQSVLDARTPSQRMGLNPESGGLTAAAAIAVDSGASPATAGMGLRALSGAAPAAQPVSEQAYPQQQAQPPAQQPILNNGKPFTLAEVGQANQAIGGTAVSVPGGWAIQPPQAAQKPAATPDTAMQPAATPAASAQSAILGRNSQPIAEGGQPFATREEAKAEKRLQPLMRVAPAEGGGFILKPASERQMAAVEKAAKRLKYPSTGETGPRSLHGFILQIGGLASGTMPDIGFDLNPRVGNRRLFSPRGKTIEQAAMAAKQEGYIQDEDENTLIEALKRSLNVSPVYTPDGYEAMAEAQMQARYEDFLAAEQDGGAENDWSRLTPEELAETGYNDYDEATQSEIRALVAQAEALGVDAESILEDVAQRTENATQKDYENAAKSAIEAAIRSSEESRSRDLGQAGAEAGPAAADTPAAPAAVTGQASDVRARNLAALKARMMAGQTKPTPATPPAQTKATPAPEAGPTNQGATNGQGQETLLKAEQPTGAAAMVSGAPVEKKTTDTAKPGGAIEKIRKAAQSKVDTAPVQQPSGSIDGIVIKPGKGLIKGKFKAEVDGVGLPGDAFNTEQEAYDAALKYREVLAKRANEGAEAQRRKDAIADSFRNGDQVTNAQIESLGLKSDFSDMRWFMSTAADLFGLNSRQIRPIVKDLIKVRRSDMGTEYEYVPTRKALEAIAASQSLTSPTKADIESQQARAEQAEKSKAAQAKADAARAAKERERKEVAAASVAAADTFELGQDAMANLTGQQDVFGAMEQEAPQMTAEEAAAYLKDFVYNLDQLDGMTPRAQVSLSSPMGKSGRDTLLMEAFGISREKAHDINNRLDSRQPKKLRNIDMQEAFDVFPGLRKIVDDAIQNGQPKAKTEPSSQFTDLEKELQAQSHATELDGDIGIVAGGGVVRYVSLDDAVSAAKKAIESGVKAVPFQIHNATGIRIGDVDRVLVQVNGENEQGDDGLMFSRDTESPRTPAATIRAAITNAYGNLLDKLEAKGLVTIAQTEREAIEAAAQARADKTGGDAEAIAGRMMSMAGLDVKYSANGNIEGFFDKQTGKSFLVADNLTAASAPGTLMHEVGIHMAAGGKMAELFKRAGSILKTGTQNAFIQRVKDRMARAGETSDEEAAAYIVTEYENDRAKAPITIGKWLADLTAAVRAWLFSKGIILKAEQLTVADIAAVARANARSMARGGPNGGPGGGIRRSFAGEGAATADKMALATARQRVEAGENTETVRKDTGWFNGVDGKWRFEINDSDASIKDRSKWTAKIDGLKSMRDAALRRKFEAEEKRNAFLRSRGESPSRISSETKREPEFKALVKALNTAELAVEKSRSNVFMAEQDGGLIKVGDVLDHLALFSAYPKISETRVAIDNGLQKGNAAYSPESNTITIPGMDDSKQLLTVLLHEIQHGIQNIEGFATGGSPDLNGGFSAYKRLAGEVESRNTEARQGMTDAQRRETAPSATADTPDSDVIVVFNGKDAMSAPAPANADPGIRFSRAADMAGNAIDKAKQTADKAMGKDFPRAASMPDLNDDQRSLLGKVGASQSPASDAIKAATDRAGLKIRQGMVDRFAALKELDEKALGQNFIADAITNSAWVLAKMSSAGSGALNAMMKTGRIEMDAQQKVIGLKGAPNGGLTASLQKLGGPAEVERFFAWMAANRSHAIIERNKEAIAKTAEAKRELKNIIEMQAIPGKTAQQVSQLSDARKEWEKVIAKHEPFLDVTERLFTEDEVAAGRTLNTGTTEGGKVRPALYSQVHAEFQQYRDDVLAIAEQTGIINSDNRAMWRDEFYVPFYRVMEDDADRGRSGGNGLSRQEAYKKLKGGKQNLNDLMENTLMNFHHLLSASLKNQAAVQAIKNAEHVKIARKLKKVNMGAEADLFMVDGTKTVVSDKKSITFILEKGKKVFYEVDDPLVFESITTLADPGLNNTAVRVMGAFKRLFTNMTTATPQFITASMFRDLLQASATSPTSKNIAKNLKEGIQSYRDEKTRAEMLASGGAFSFGHIYGMGADEVKASLQKTAAGAGLISKPSMIPSILRKGWDAWGDITDLSENASRAATYAQNVDQMGKLRAAFEARDVMDFSQHGAWPAVRLLVRIVPFLNARLQGLDKLYRSGLKPSILTAMGKGTDTDKQAAARFAMVTGALTLATMALYIINADDDEYKKLPEWQKDTYWFIRIGDMKYFLPKPFEVGAIATIAERTLQQAMDDKATGKLFKERMWDMLMQTFAFNPTPQMFQPLVDVYSNKDAFTGRDIETAGMERMSAGLRSRDTTTAPATALSAVSRVFGDESSIAVSPVQADHLIKGYLGGVGVMAAGVIDTMYRAATGESEPDKSWMEHQPFRRFMADATVPNANTRYTTLFYDGLKEANRVYADVMELQKLGQPEDAATLAAEKRNVLQMRIALNAQQRRLTEINNRMKEVRRSDKDGEWKRREIDLLNTQKAMITERMGKRIEDERAQ